MAFKASLKLIAGELRLGSGALGEVVGQENSAELLGRTFSEFCVGK
jgi:tRNA U34 5-carboxymethylaminomethyl modifying GTPase MnmE/TrmE